MAAPTGGGAIYRVTTNGSQSVLHSLSSNSLSTNVLNGYRPFAPLVCAQNGSLYGITSSGGSNGVGTIFKITTNGAFSLLYSFGATTNASGDFLDGSYSYSGLLQARDGNFYGVTYSGGLSNNGTVFRFSTNNTLTTLHSFTGAISNDDGAYPYTAALVEGADGVFYGTTSEGGTNGEGTVFQITAAGALTTLVEFNKTNGANPYAGLSFGNDGCLYGTTVYGGTNTSDVTNTYGTAFRVTTNGALTVLYEFGSSDGFYFPEGGLVPGIGDALYGSAYEGGTSGYGALFQLTTNGLLTELYAFTDGTDGAYPYAGVMRDSAGNLYGATLYGGGSGGYGAVFSWGDPTRPTNTITLPTAGQRWSNSVFTASGKARDNIGVASVFYSINGSVWTEATTTNRWTNWTGQAVSLLPGTNLFQGYAMDYSGNFSVTTNVYFQYVVTNQLGLRAAGLGAINPNYSNAWLEIGRNYNITSTPASGFKFVNWVVSTNWGGGVVVSTTNLQFMMASNLTLQAILVDTAKPTLTITAPTAGQKMSNALALVRGTAADNWHLSNVWYRLNSNSWNLATTTNGFTNWYTPTLTLTAGTNSVNAYALDLAGNLSTTGSVSFFSSNTFKLQMSFAATQPLTSTGLNLSVQLSSGLSGQVQVSTNLLNWQSLTNFSGTNTTLKIIDPAATNSGQRFYRAVTQ